MFNQLIKETRGECERALLQPDLRKVKHALEQNEVSPAQLVTLVREISEPEATLKHFRELKNRLLQSLPDLDEIALERYALIHGALVSLDKLIEAPICYSVQALICKKFQWFANLDDGWRPQFRVGCSSFAAMCKMVTMRRFPAGQLDWEISGLPRSWIFKVGPRDLPRLLHYVMRRLGGFAPAFFAHVTLHKKDSLFFLEREINRSYHRMAKCLELQPSIRGFLTSSWFYSRETFRVSPHLAWLTKVFLENDGLVVDTGPAELDSGVFTRSPERKRLYESGQFKPTNALVVWGRNEMIKWASNHPEFGE